MTTQVHHDGAEGGPVRAFSRDGLVDGAFLLGLSVLAMIGLRTVYPGVTFLLVGALGLVLGIAVAALGLRFRLPVVVVVVVLAGAVYFLLGPAVAAHDDAIAGVVPSGPALRLMGTTAVDGWKQLLTTLPPVPQDSGLLALPWLLGLLGGSLGFTIARRARSAGPTLVVPTLMLVATIALGTSKPAATILQGAVYAAVALVWAAVRSARTRSSATSGSMSPSRVATGLGLVAAVVLIGAAAGPSLPGGTTQREVLRDHITPPFDIKQYPSPLVGFRKYTEAAEKLYDETLFTATGVPDGAYVRIATLDSFDGSVWGASNGGGTVDGAQSGFVRVGSEIATAASGDEITVTFTIAPAYASATDTNAWLPSVGSATKVQFEGENAEDHAETFRYNLAISQGLVPDRLKDGDRYVVTAVVGPGDQAEGVLDPTAKPYGSPTMPSTSFGFTSAQTDKWSGAATEPVARLKAIGEHLASEGAYSDGGPGQEMFLPGHGLGRLSKDFLNAKEPVGDDEQYAAAFALMANQIGVPARVVLGAVPQSDGTVTGADVHAWVEVSLAGVGWTSISPAAFMPDKSQVPQVPEQTTPPQQDAKIIPPPNPQQPPSALDPSTEESAAAANARPSATSPGWVIPGFLVGVVKATLPPVLLVGAFCAVVLGLKTRRRQRRRTEGPPAARIAGGWSELTDLAADMGGPVVRDATRREEASALVTFEVAGLADEADAQVFGPGDPSDDDAAGYWDRVDATRQALMAKLPRSRRWRAALSLRSLRRRPSRRSEALA